MSGPRLTVGVEEEFLLVDPDSRMVAPRAEEVIATAVLELGGLVGPELTRYQVETRTEPHVDLADLAEQLYAHRVRLARAAAGHGVRIVSSGGPVLAPDGTPPVMPGERYARSVAAFGALDDDQVSCALHIHVGLDDRHQALQVGNHLRVWLPALIALAANSPFWRGRDTGYASWRAVAWRQWPVSGPPPYFDSLQHYEELVTALIGTGTTLDRAGIYWDIRPSHHLPTLEIRVADAALTVDDAVLLAALVRAAAATALDAFHHGGSAPRPDPQLLDAACWRAARDGLAGKAVDLAGPRLEPAECRLHALLSWVRPALQHHGDARHVDALVSRLKVHGTGSDRQHAAHRRRHRLIDTVDDLVAHVLSPPTRRLA
ncbi:glutamate--cysteine ligase [Kitasatospora sp. NPDC059648]|uniref:carboxylate-amine ligase n=1 Tax=Kitasatospora sp. NPDC059648 TaxID=3346894 RepID=UPI0036CC7AD0